MIFSVIDEHDEQQLVNVLHIARVSCPKGTTRACIHLVNGQWIKTIHSIKDIQTQIDGTFKRTCEWLRFMGLQQYEVDDKGIDRANTVHDESLELPFLDTSVDDRAGESYPKYTTGCTCQVGCGTNRECKLHGTAVNGWR